MKKIFAVIGYGGMGSWHTKQILQSDVAELSGIYDIDPLKSKAANENGIYAYSSLEELLCDEKVSAVVIATPNDVHKELTIKCLNAGKNVICEKPVEMTVSAFDKMVAAAKSVGKIFAVHQNRRWDGDFLTLKNLIESGEIGDLINIESRVHGCRGIPGDWRGEKIHGGGMMLDWGVHLIDQVLQIIKEKIVKIYCTATHITNLEVDDGFKLTLYFESGKTAYLEVGTYNFIVLPRLYMQCEKGSVLINGFNSNAIITKIKSWEQEDVKPVQTAAGLTKTMAPRNDFTLDSYEKEQPKSDVHDFYRNFCATIDGKEELLVKHQEVRRVLDVMETAFVSINKQQVINKTI